MIILVIASIFALIVFATYVATVIAWESLPMDRTPAWLDNLYNFFTRN